MTIQQPETTQPRKLITPLRLATVLVVLVALLLADLYFRGMVWQYIYDRTGEETIAGQIQGMVEFSGNLIRIPPRTDPAQAIQHTDIFPYGVNTFFEQETELDKMHVQFQMIADAGFGWIRQEFPWEDIEIDGRGEFTDSRVDYDGDGENETIDAWEKYDTIVDLVDEYDLDMIVRLSNPPAWSRAENPGTAGGATAPPDDYQDFVNYAVAVAERYEGRIQYYQVWNEPNIYPEWGEQFANPADYTRLLCMTYNALKAVDPEIVVISGTIAPTASLDGYFGYHDLVYLQNMYDAGASNCFDVLSAQGYGLNSGPTDQRYRITHLSFARHVQYRDIMVTNGDSHKPIWLSEVAWSPVEDTCLMTGECLSRDEIAGAGQFGSVTNEQAARYLQEAYDRIREDWPWVGHVSYWHFTRPTIDEKTGVAYWFRMVEADYSPETPTFSPLPVYTAAQEYIAHTIENPVLHTGTHQAESWETTLSDTAEVVAIEGAEFGEAVQTRTFTATVRGTSITLRYQTDSPVLVTRSGEVLATLVPDPSVQWQERQLSNGVFPQTSTYTLISEDPFLVDSVRVGREFWVHVLPLFCGLGAIAGAFLILAFPIWRQRRADAKIEADRRHRQAAFRQQSR